MDIPAVVREEFRARRAPQPAKPARPSRVRVTKQHPAECRECNGLGQSLETQTRVEKHGDKHVTTVQGSGCPRCLGTGRL
jgi:hypothetical protein